MNAKVKPIFLVIDPLISTQWLLNRFNQHDIDLLALKTLKEEGYTATRSYQNLPFIGIIDALDQDIDKALANIDHFCQTHGKLIGGFSGTEGSTDYAEKILYRLFPRYSNSPKTSHYRYNKYWMNEVLKQANLPAINQMIIEESKTLDEKMAMAERFYHENDGHIVIKPNSGSAGSIGVLKPDSIDAIRNYFKEGYDTWFHLESFLLQEYIEGKEYYADYASFNGKHFLTAVGTLEKTLIGGAFSYKYSDNISLEDPLVEEIKDYTLKCLDALGVKSGFSHFELRKSPRCYRLIELNPRISGSSGFHNVMAKNNHGVDQIDAYLSLTQGKIPALKKVTDKYQRLFFFHSYKGDYQKVDTKPIESLSSYAAHKLFIPSMSSSGARTATLFDTVMLVLLASDNQAQIESDTQLLEAYQRNDQCLIS
ncbi:MAG: ATP-grasp domain-containing protein [Pseudomonadota bacterium]